MPLFLLAQQKQYSSIGSPILLIGKFLWSLIFFRDILSISHAWKDQFSHILLRTEDKISVSLYCSLYTKTRPMLLAEWYRACFLDLRADGTEWLAPVHLTSFPTKQVTHIQSVYWKLFLTYTGTLNCAQLPPGGVLVGIDRRGVNNLTIWTGSCQSLGPLCGTTVAVF